MNMSCRSTSGSSRSDDARGKAAAFKTCWKQRFARGVRRKGKELAEYMARVIDEGYHNRVTVDRCITDRTKDTKAIMGSHDLQIGVPTKRQRLAIAEVYYEGGEA